MAQTSTSLPGTLGLVPSLVPSDQAPQSALRPAPRHAVGQFSPDQRLPSPARVSVLGCCAVRVDQVSLPSPCLHCTTICPPNTRFSLTWRESESGLSRPLSAPHGAWAVGGPHVGHEVSDAAVITRNRWASRGASQRQH